MMIFAPLHTIIPVIYLFVPHFKNFWISSSHTSGFWQYSQCPAPSTLTTRQSLVPSFSSSCSNAKPRRSWNIFWFHHVRFHVSTNQMLQHNIYQVGEKLFSRSKIHNGSPRSSLHHINTILESSPSPKARTPTTVNFYSRLVFERGSSTGSTCIPGDIGSYFFQSTWFHRCFERVGFVEFWGGRTETHKSQAQLNLKCTAS